LHHRFYLCWIYPGIANDPGISTLTQNSVTNLHTTSRDPFHSITHTPNPTFCGNGCIGKKTSSLNGLDWNRGRVETSPYTDIPVPETMEVIFRKFFPVGKHMSS
jgi:hypothetical protein